MEYTPLFTYGTLMQGESNHDLIETATFLGEDALDGACLYDLGPYPMILREPGRVYGERYQIPLTLLPALDELEDHPEVYQRQWIALVSGISAWVYVGRPQFTQGCAPIQNGRWRERF